MCVGVIAASAPTWRQFGLEHVQSDHVDDHDPNGAVQQLGFGLDEGYAGNALALEATPVRVRLSQFATHVRLEFLHVEQLEKITSKNFNLESYTQKMEFEWDFMQEII